MKQISLFHRAARCAAVTAALIFVLLASHRAARATEQGTLIHFPAKLDEDWAPSEAAARDAAQMLGAGAWLRFDYLWHEHNWEPFAPANNARLEKIIGICKREKLRPLMNIIPHPWPGSEWAAPWQPQRDWGDPDPRMFPWIARRYAEDVAAYRAVLRAQGMAETEAALQFGNEPAAGHPGGNGQLTKGTWSAAALWTQCNALADYGALHVVSPALSMQDHAPEVALRERESARAGAENWSAPVTSWGLHNRVHRPDLAGDEYANLHVQTLANRARTTLDLWPKGDKTRQSERDKGVWVTESYVAVGDVGGDRAASVKAISQKLKEGVPGVAVFIWYRWFPAAPEGQVQWQFDLPSKRAIGEVVQSQVAAR